MALSSVHTDWLKGSFMGDRDFLLKVAENNPLRLGDTDSLCPTHDGNSSIALGYGFDLITSGNIAGYLSQVGITWTPTAETIRTQAKGVRNQIISLQKQLKNTTDPTVQQHIQEEIAVLKGNLKTYATQFEQEGITLSDESQATQLLHLVLTDSEQALATLLQGDMPTASRERAVLISMYYQTPELIGKGLRAALRSGDRAEAWFQIRYASNGNKLPGVAMRRYFEADYFGLYDNRDTLVAGALSSTNDENAKGAFRVMTRKRPNNIEAYAYEQSWSAQIAKAQQEYSLNPGSEPLNDVSFVGALTDDLAPARSYLIAQYGQGVAINGSILVGEDNGTTSGVDTRYYRGTDADVLAGTNQSDLIFGESGNDVLRGGLGGDVIYGGADDDYLEGGAGADTLIGGAGHDTYIWNDGENAAQDRVIDEDHSGRFVFRDAAGNTRPLSGDYVEVDATTWRNVTNAAVVLTHASNWTLTLPDGGTVDLGEDFQWGEFDLTLAPTLTTPQTVSTLQGGDLGDALDGNYQNELIQGWGGGDWITAEGGDDRVEGGGGPDVIAGGTGADFLLGGPDRDVLWGEDGNDSLYADAEITLTTAIAQGETDQPTGLLGELLDGAGGADIVVGGAGDDAVLGGGGNDVVVAGAGNDLLAGDGTISSLSRDWTMVRQVNGTVYTWGVLGVGGGAAGDPGDDALYGGAGDDWIFGGGGDDLLDGGSGADVLQGEAGADTLYGGDGDDVLDGGADDDSLSGDAGNDWLHGAAGDDVVEGGAGTDTVIGDTGDDYLDGGADSDEVRGEAGVDILYGGSGNDVLFGDAEGLSAADQGADYLDGEAGNDTLRGFVMGDVGK